ncbi:MAG: peptidoglycan-binding protein, partial [Patescibacteria group bacterium]
LTAGTTYSYTVSSYDGAGNISTLSGTGSVTTLAPVVTLDSTAPTVPGTPTVSGITTTSATLSWGASTDAVGVTGYKMYRNNVEIATGVIATTYSATGLSPSTSYSFAISAYDVANNLSAKSTAVNVSTLTPPVAPVITTPTVVTPPDLAQYPERVTSVSITGITDSSISFSWNAVGGDIARYIIRRDGVDLQGTTILSFTDSVLANSNSYEYAVCSESSRGLRTCSTPFTVTTRERVVPSTETGTQGASSNQSIATPVPVGISGNTSSRPSLPVLISELQEVWPTAPGKFVFYPGVHANEVYELQRSLIRGGYLTQAGISGAEGWYGNKTKNAVANFQLQNKIISNTSSSVLGIVGPTTLNRLNSILGAGIYSVSKGGVDATPAGVSKTPVSAPAPSGIGVAGFGLSGPEVWPTTKDSRFLLYRGVYAEEVLKLQQCFISGGYLQNGSTSGGEGWYGKKTASAVGKFQVQNGILSSNASPAYGIVGPTTLSRLNSILNCGITITR